MHCLNWTLMLGALMGVPFKAILYNSTAYVGPETMG